MPLRLFIFLFFNTYYGCAFAQDTSIINSLKPDYFSSNFNTYSQKTAIYLGNLSELVYKPEDSIGLYCGWINEAYPDAGYKCHFIEDPATHTQMMLWGNRERVILAFRGTEPSHWRDILTDIKIWVYKNKESTDSIYFRLPPGHGGFRKACMKLIREQRLVTQLDSFIRVCNPTANLTEFPIYTTGHSLGAALSQLLIRPLVVSGHRFSGAYHFAPPLAVGKDTALILQNDLGESIYDIVNYKDAVTRLTKSNQNKLAHFGKFYRICIDSTLNRESPEIYYSFTFKERTAKFEFYLHKLLHHLQLLSLTANNDVLVRSREGVCIKP